MLTNHVGCHYVVTSVTFYHSAIVDLTLSRSVHAIEHDPCCPDPTKLSASECKAVHYGICSPLLKLPSFSIPPAAAASSNPASPATPKASSPLSTSASNPNSPSKGIAPSIAELLGAAGNRSPSTTVGSPVFNRSPSPATSSSPANVQSPVAVQSTKAAAVAVSSPAVLAGSGSQEMELGMVLDPVSLLASDLEDQLEALVNSFVAQDKVRNAARKKAESTPGSAGKTSTTGIGNRSAPRSKKVVDKKPKRDERSSDDESASSSEAPKVNGVGKKELSGAKVVAKPGKYSLEGDAGKKASPEANQERNLFTFDGQHQLFRPHSPFTQFEENLLDRSSSPSFKTTVLPSVGASPEYQQTGVKAQINKFASKERDSPLNTVEKRHANDQQKSNESSPPFVPQIGQVRTGPMMLDALQKLLLTTIPDPVPQTAVFQNAQPVLYHAKEGVSPSSPAETSSYKSESRYANEELDTKFPKNGETQGATPSRAYSQQIQSTKEQHVQSAVDYAKSRFQSSSSLSKDETRPSVRPTRNGHLVSDAKSRWESLPAQGWSGDQGDGDGPSDLRKTSGHKRTLSMEGLLDAASPSIPHPKLTTAQRQHIKERSLSPTDRHAHVPIRPFLTKGSVAERVLLFECRPDTAVERTAAGAGKAKNNLISTWRPGGSDVHTKTQFWEVVAGPDKTLCGPHSASVAREREAPPRVAKWSGPRGGQASIPRFHFPDGRPRAPHEVEEHLKKVAAVFSGLNEGKATRGEFHIVTKACGLPLYWKLPLFLAARDKRPAVSCEAFLDFWRKVVTTCHDESSKFIRILTRGKRNYLIGDDFFPMMQDVIDSHPGLTFLKEAVEFHSRYIHTVIARIFYCVNRSWSGKITAAELRKSNFLQVLATLEEEEDINQITEYFSYEHFYVIYCKFWELDKDHDLYIDQNDLKLHSGGALSSRIIQRIFSGAVTRGGKQKEGKMSYMEFVWFLISEEDKRHPRSIEYWFRCMDVDGDGFLSMYELEYFYEEQLQRLEALGIETLPFNDCLCQMLDIIKPREAGKVSLSDLKRCKLTPLFFDTFFNLEKYLDHEQRDPFACQKEHDGEGLEMSDWDRYAAEEYELLVAEESAAEQADDMLFKEYEEYLANNPDNLSNVKVTPPPPDTEDEYDYADSDDYHY